MSTLKFKTSVLKRYYVIWLEQRCFLFGEGFLQKYSANILKAILLKLVKGVLKNTGGVMQKYREMILKKYCKVFCTTTKMCVMKTCWEVFCKTTEMCSANILILRIVLQKYLKVLGEIAEGGCTFWQKLNNILVKTQGLGLFPLRSWPFILGGQKTSIYWEQSH